MAHGKDDEQPNGLTSTRKKMFVVRHKKNARQTIDLPCAKIKTHDKLFFYRAFFLPCAVENAHGKAPLCRAPENMRTAKIETHGNHHFSGSDRGQMHTLTHTNFQS
jgi:hypothetical protein